MDGPVAALPSDQLLASSQVRELVSGVDALYLSGRAPLSASLFEVLEQRRAEAQEVGASVPLVVAGEEFGVAPHAMGRYRFMLEHRCGLVGVTAKPKLPPLRVQPRAEFLHAVGPVAALGFFDRIGEYLAGGPVGWGLARLDLFCDVQGWQLCGDDRDRFVSPSRALTTHEDSGVLTGFDFGRRTSGTVVCRVYDKTVQVAKKGHDWWEAVWGPRFDPFEPVWRVEFEISRKALGQFGVTTPIDGLEKAGAMWGGLTSTWLTYRDRGTDHTKSRWPVAPAWQVIQQASLRGNAVGEQRITDGAHRGDLRTILPALIGYLASLASIEGTTDARSTLQRTLELVAADERDRGVCFEERIEDRNRARRYR